MIRVSSLFPTFILPFRDTRQKYIFKRLSMSPYHMQWLTRQIRRAYAIIWTYETEEMDPILAFCLFFFLALFFSFFQNRASSNEHSNKSIIVNWIQLFIRDNAKMPRTRNKASRAYKAMRRKFHRHNVSQARRESPIGRQSQRDDPVERERSSWRWRRSEKIDDYYSRSRWVFSFLFFSSTLVMSRSTDRLVCSRALSL